MWEIWKLGGMYQRLGYKGKQSNPKAGANSEVNIEAKTEVGTAVMDEASSRAYQCHFWWLRYIFLGTFDVGCFWHCCEQSTL